MKRIWFFLWQVTIVLAAVLATGLARAVGGLTRLSYWLFERGIDDPVDFRRQKQWREELSRSPKSREGMDEP